MSDYTIEEIEELKKEFLRFRIVNMLIQNGLETRNAALKTDVKEQARVIKDLMRERASLMANVHYRDDKLAKARDALEGIKQCGQELWDTGQKKKINYRNSGFYDAYMALCSYIDDALAALDQNKPEGVWRPHIVCLCGSTKFKDEFVKQNYRLTLAGKIVLTIGCDTKSDNELGITDEQKTKLDELHKCKIDVADSVLVLNVGGYVGKSTAGEIVHAINQGKPVEWLEPDRAHSKDQALAILRGKEGE